MKFIYCLATAIIIAFTFSACKKDADNGKDSVNMVYLEGSFSEGFFVSYNAFGEPLIYRQSYVYEWSNTSKTFRKIGDALNDIVLSGLGREMTADKIGNYYFAEYDDIYHCNGAEGHWTKLNFPGVNYAQMIKFFPNEQGDILIEMLQNEPNLMIYKYFLKKSNETVWNEIAVDASITTLTRDILPYWLNNNGNLYFHSTSGPQSQQIADRYLNTSTGNLEVLFDKSDPANYKWAYGVIDAYTCIQPSGMVYFMHGPDLYRFDGNVIPIKPVKIMTFENPLDKAHNDPSWSTSLADFIVDAAGNIKMIGYCSYGFSAHWGYITGNIKSSKLTLHDHELTQRQLFFNQKNEVFMQTYPYNGLYKWE